MQFRLTHIILALALIVPVAEQSARDRSAGRPLFEEAYAAEKQDPQLALELYERALKKGLGKELKKAARWRLFYLYRKAGRYGEALGMAARLGSDKKLRNVLGDLYDEIAVRYSVPRDAAREYANGLKLLALERDAQAALRFEKALQLSKSAPKGNTALRTAITNRLVGRGDSQTALTVLRSEKDKSGARLARVDLLVKLKRDKEARKLLAQIAADPASAKWSHADQSQVFYLLARISRRASQAAATVRWFRLAAVHAKFAGDAALQSRMQSLAAYELFLRGHARPARELMRGLPASKDWNVRLLDLMLRAYVDGNAASRKQLQALLDEQPGRKNRLTEAASKIAAGRRLVVKTQANGVPGFPFAAPPSKKELAAIQAEARAQEAAGKEPTAKPKPLSYWQNRFAKDTDSELVLEVPEGHELVLFRSQAELQMHGASRNGVSRGVKLSKPLRIPDKLQRLDALLRDARGHYALLALPRREAEELETESEAEKKAGAETEAENKATEAKAPASARIRRDQIVDARLLKPVDLESDEDEDWLLVHLYSNGKGWVFVELEEDAGRTRMPEYRHGWLPVESLRIVYD